MKMGKSGILSVHCTILLLMNMASCVDNDFVSQITSETACPFVDPRFGTKGGGVQFQRPKVAHIASRKISSVTDNTLFQSKVSNVSTSGNSHFNAG